MRLHFRILVSGTVQGVGFRYWAKSLATVLGINGLAKNRSDGTVLIEAEGEKEALDHFTRRCWEGPVLAKVKRVEVKEGEVKNYSGFEVKQGV